MKRIRLLLAMAAFGAAIVLVVCFASPYAPVVGAAPENIEDIWAIEDVREESEAPLVTALENQGVPLAYDAQKNTFYCTLGMDNAETWPKIHITAPDSPDLKLMFVDDYTYDWCRDAICDGYAYQVLAYNETQFAYFDLVFTGLPIVQIEAEQEITTEDVPISVSISAYGCEPVRSYARAHLRGASTLNYEKKSYKIEFAREKDGRRKTTRNVPGFKVMDSINLNPMAHDELMIREKLSWDLYESLVSRDEPFGARMTQYAEVFLNGTYQGAYLLVEPMDCEEELGLQGTRALTDSVYRTAVLSFSRDRAYIKHPYRGNTGYELYYHPASGTADAFEHLQPWIDLNKAKDDEQFIRRGLACVDFESMVKFDLFVQAGGMTDNVFNNMYIIAHPASEGIRYTFAPWDMDMTWGRKKAEVGENFENWIYFPVADRLIELNAGGLRQLVAKTWAQMRAGLFNVEFIEQKLAEYSVLLGESGAWARNAERWERENYTPDFYDVLVFAELRFDLMDEAIEAIARTENKKIPFLSATQYEGKGTPIVFE